MADDHRYESTPRAELYDPLIVPPPKGTKILVVNPGGVLLVSEWFEGAVAWGRLPQIPASVKARMSHGQTTD